MRSLRRPTLAITLVTVLSVLLFTAPQLQAQGSSPRAGSIVESYRAAADQLIEAALRDSFAYERLANLVDRYGHRLSGSESLERAIDWILGEMRGDGLENVHGEQVMIRRWVRGDESLQMVSPRKRELPVLGLGGSIGTGREGVGGEVLVVDSFADLVARAAEAEGRIVLFDVPFTSYRATVQYRVTGAVAAARVGAVASLIRSVTPFSMNTPHTGQMRYDPSVRPIPHAAITVEDAEMIHRMQNRGEPVELVLKMEATTYPDVPSRNVIGEIVGSERPEEVVVIGGHIDSWDVGHGAMDDAGGSVAAWEAVRLMHQLGLRPRRTIRVVLWTNEEIGLRGARAYRDAHMDELGDHVLAIESDAGVFKPTGFGFTGSEQAYRMIREVGTLLDEIGAGAIERGGGGADIGPLMRLGVPGMGLRVEGSRYFWYHHSEADTIDKLDPREMGLCVAALAVMAYVVADMPERLPR